MKIRIRIPLSWRRQQRWCPSTDQLEPLHRYFFFNASPDDSVHFCGLWAKAYTVRFGVGYA